MWLCLLHSKLLVHVQLQSGLFSSEDIFVFTLCHPRRRAQCNKPKYTLATIGLCHDEASIVSDLKPHCYKLQKSTSTP